jgi:stage V sporulation protein AC
MADEQKKSLSPTQQQYQVLVSNLEPKRPLALNMLMAFLFGGLICIIGELVMLMFIEWFGFSEKSAGDPTVAIMILLSVVLTSFGVYDKIAQVAGAGTAVPVTGFANSMASAALEYRSEGYVLGVGGNMFKVAGPVIVFGVVAAFVVAIVHTLLRIGGVI